MKTKSFLSCLLLLTLMSAAQNWQFVKPFYQQNSFNTSDGYSPGKIKQFSSGKLIRRSPDENRTIL
ncbi:MAG: hypothetical protein JWO32_1197 [Bacteroidetes bacterium]|nr:hypothetical protein [Bacteroidota bacterium]